jgi:hypothetical protein
VSGAPRLDELHAHPERAATLSPEVRAQLLIQCAGVLVALGAPAVTAAADGAKPSPDGLDVLTTKRLAKLWGMPEGKIRELCRQGKIPARKLGSKEWIVATAALRDWLATRPLDSSLGLPVPSVYDPEAAGAHPPQAAPVVAGRARPHPRRPRADDQGVGVGKEGPERHDRHPAPHRGAAGAASGAAPAGVNSSSKGAVA